MMEESDGPAPSTYGVYLRCKVEQGLRDADEGRLLEHEEVERRMASWLDRASRPQARREPLC